MNRDKKQNEKKAKAPHPPLKPKHPDTKGAPTITIPRRNTRTRTSPRKNGYETKSRNE